MSRRTSPHNAHLAALLAPLKQTPAHSNNHLDSDLAASGVFRPPLPRSSSPHKLSHAAAAIQLPPPHPNTRFANHTNADRTSNTPQLTTPVSLSRSSSASTSSVSSDLSVDMDEKDHKDAALCGNGCFTRLTRACLITTQDMMRACANHITRWKKGCDSGKSYDCSSLLLLDETCDRQPRIHCFHSGSASNPPSRTCLCPLKWKTLFRLLILVVSGYILMQHSFLSNNFSRGSLQFDFVRHSLRPPPNHSHLRPPQTVRAKDNQGEFDITVPVESHASTVGSEFASETAALESIIAWTQVSAGTVQANASSSSESKPKSILQQLETHPKINHIRSLFISASSCGASISRYLLWSCSSSHSKPSDSNKSLQPMFQLVKAAQMAVATNRTLLVDSSICKSSHDLLGSDPTQGDEFVESCCALLELIRPISRCLIAKPQNPNASPDSKHGDNNDVASPLHRSLRMGFHNSSSLLNYPTLFNPQSDARFVFYSEASSCAFNQQEHMWRSIEAQQQSSSDVIFSRQLYTRFLTALVTQPQKSIHTEVSRILRRVAHRVHPSAGDSHNNLEFMTVYVPHLIGDAGSMLSSPIAPASDVNRMHEPVNLPSFIHAIKLHAANTGIRNVMVWTDSIGYLSAEPDHPSASLSESSMPKFRNSTELLSHLQSYFPHLSFFDVHQISSQVLSTPTSPTPVTSSMPVHSASPLRKLLQSNPSASRSAQHTHSQYLALLVATSPASQLLIGAFAEKAVRLATFLIPAQLATHNDFMPSPSHSNLPEFPPTLVPLIPFVSLDSSSWYIDCVSESTGTVAHSSLYGNLIGNSRRPPASHSDIGRLLQPISANEVGALKEFIEQIDGKSYSSDKSSVTADTASLYYLPAQRIRLVLLTGDLRTATRKIRLWFDSVGARLHEPLSAFLVDIFEQPKTIDQFLTAKRTFVQMLEKEVIRLAQHTERKYRSQLKSNPCAVRDAPTIVMQQQSVDSIAKLFPLSEKDNAFDKFTRFDVAFLQQLLIENPILSTHVELKLVHLTKPIEQVMEEEIRSVDSTNLPIEKDSSEGPVIVPSAPDWRFPQFIRMYRDWSAVFDGQLRSLHPSTYTLITQDSITRNATFVGEKLELFLNGVVRKRAYSEVDAEWASLDSGHSIPEFVLTERDHIDSFSTCTSALITTINLDGDATLPSITHQNVHSDSSADQKLHSSEPVFSAGLSLLSFLASPVAQEYPIPGLNSRSMGYREKWLLRDLFPSIAEQVKRDQEHHPTNNSTYPSTSAELLQLLSDPTTTTSPREMHLITSETSRSESLVNEQLSSASHRLKRFAQQMKIRILKLAYDTTHAKQQITSSEVLPQFPISYLSSDLSTALRFLQTPSSHRKQIFQAIKHVGIEYSSEEQDDPTAFDCSDPSLKFLVFTAFNDLSELPRVMTRQLTRRNSNADDLAHAEPLIKQLPLLDDFSLTGTYSLSHQFQSLNRALAIALLTGRMLVLPPIPNTIIELLDLSQVTQCSLDSIGLTLEKHRQGESGAEDLPREVAIRYSIKSTSTSVPHELSSDPLDLSARISTFDSSTPIAAQMSFEWLAATQSPLGALEFTSELTGHFLASLTAKTTDFVKAPKQLPTSFLGIHLPHVSGVAAFDSTAKLTQAILHHSEQWNLISSSQQQSMSQESEIPSKPILTATPSIYLSYNPSFDSHIGSGASGRGEGNSLFAGDQRGLEWNAHHTNVRIARYPIKHRAQSRSGVQPSIKRELSITRTLQHAARGQRLRVSTSPRHQPLPTLTDSATDAAISPFSLYGLLGFSSSHTHLLATILADVIRMSESALLIQSHSSEESLLISQIRMFVHKQATHARLNGSPAHERSMPMRSAYLASSSSLDLHGWDYLTGLAASQENLWKLHVFTHADLHLDLAFQKQLKDANSLSVATTASTHSSTFYSSLLTPPTLLSTVPPPIPLVLKRQYSSNVRFVFVAGVEGVGHHYFDAILSRMRQYDSVMDTVNFGQLRTDDTLSTFVHTMFIKNGLTNFKESLAQVRNFIRSVQNELAREGEKHDKPLVVFLNMLSSGDGGMMSYPNGESNNRHLHHPDLAMLSRIFEEASADLRIVTMYRSMGAAFASTVRRNHGRSSAYRDPNDARTRSENVLFQTRVMPDSLSIIEADLRKIDPAFNIRINLDHLSTFPHSNAHLISAHTGLNMDPLLKAMLQMSLDPSIKVKSPITWTRNLSQHPIDIARLHLSVAHQTAKNVGLSVESASGQPELIQRVDNHHMRHSAAHQQIIQQLEQHTGSGTNTPSATSLSLDELDTGVSSPLCISPFDLSSVSSVIDSPISPPPARSVVALHGLEGSGEELVRFAVEQVTGYLTGGGLTIRNMDQSKPQLLTTLTPAPTFAIPSKTTRVRFTHEVAQLTASGQVALTSHAECISCNMTLRVKDLQASFVANPTEMAPSSAVAVTLAASHPSNSLPSKRVFLLRNPLEIAQSLAVSAAKDQSYFMTNAGRLSVQMSRLTMYKTTSLKMFRDSIMGPMLDIAARRFMQWAYKHRKFLFPAQYAWQLQQHFHKHLSTPVQSELSETVANEDESAVSNNSNTENLASNDDSADSIQFVSRIDHWPSITDIDPKMSFNEFQQRTQFSGGITAPTPTAAKRRLLAKVATEAQQAAATKINPIQGESSSVFFLRHTALRTSLSESIQKLVQFLDLPTPPREADDTVPQGFHWTCASREWEAATAPVPAFKSKAKTQLDNVGFRTDSTLYGKSPAATSAFPTPAQLFISSLVSDDAISSDQFPFTWAQAICEEDVRLFEARLHPLLSYFDWQFDIDVLKARAKVYWEENANSRH